MYSLLKLFAIGLYRVNGTSTYPPINSALNAVSECGKKRPISRKQVINSVIPARGMNEKGKKSDIVEPTKFENRQAKKNFFYIPRRTTPQPVDLLEVISEPAPEFITHPLFPIPSKSFQIK